MEGFFADSGSTAGEQAHEQVIAAKLVRHRHRTPGGADALVVRVWVPAMDCVAIVQSGLESSSGDDQRLNFAIRSQERHERAAHRLRGFANARDENPSSAGKRDSLALHDQFVAMAFHGRGHHVLQRCLFQGLEEQLEKSVLHEEGGPSPGLRD